MKRALVFGGGGSKGAYEIGVWKALDTLGQTFDIVTGTSIGSMIGVLYVQRQYDKVIELWDNLHVEDIMTNGVNIDLDMELLMSQKEKYHDFLSSYIHNKGADITPFEDLLRRYFDAERFFSSPIDYACMTVNVTKKKQKVFFKKDMTQETVLDYIIASGSCFPMFPMKEIDGEMYVDGGYYDNVPIHLAESMGAEEVVAVNLKAVGILRTNDIKADVICIEPHVSLGSFLLFDKEVIHRNIQLGYQDTLKKFNYYIGTIYTFDKKQKKEIEAVEDVLKYGMKTIEETLQREKMKFLVEKIVFHQVLDAIDSYMSFPYPYLAILESCAFSFRFDDLKVWDFKQFLTELLRFADEHAHISFNKKIDLKNVKKDGSMESVCLLYHYLLKEDANISALGFGSVVFNDSFIKAYALYLLKQHG